MKKIIGKLIELKYSFFIKKSKNEWTRVRKIEKKLKKMKQLFPPLRVWGCCFIPESSLLIAHEIYIQLQIDGQMRRTDGQVIVISSNSKERPSPVSFRYRVLIHSKLINRTDLRQTCELVLHTLIQVSSLQTTVHSVESLNSIHYLVNTVQSPSKMIGKCFLGKALTVEFIGC